MNKKRTLIITAASVFTISTTISQLGSINDNFSIIGGYYLSASVLKYSILFINLLAWGNVIYVVFLSKGTELHNIMLIV